MIDDLIKSTEKYFPLTINNIIWDEDNLCIYGDNWSLNTMSPFRITKKDFLIGNFDSEIKDYLNELIGKKIVKLLPFGGKWCFDFSLELETLEIIDIFSNSYFEPWIFKIEDEITFVPSY